MFRITFSTEFFTAINSASPNWRINESSSTLDKIRNALMTCTHLIWGGPRSITVWYILSPITIFLMQTLQSKPWGRFNRGKDSWTDQAPINSDNPGLNSVFSLFVNKINIFLTFRGAISSNGLILLSILPKWASNKICFLLISIYFLYQIWLFLNNLPFSIKIVQKIQIL